MDIWIIFSHQNSQGQVRLKLYLPDCLAHSNPILNFPTYYYIMFCCYEL